MMMSLFVSRARQSFGITASNRSVAPNPNDIVLCRPRCWATHEISKYTRAVGFVNKHGPTERIEVQQWEVVFLSSPCRDVLTRTFSWESMVEAMNQLYIHQRVRTSAEDAVRIHYQEMTNEKKHRFHWSLECVNQGCCYSYL